MTSLRLTVGQQVCAHTGCDQQGGIFGYCKRHEEPHIRKLFEETVAKGLCTNEPPKCFDTHAKWQEYVAACMVSRKDEAGYVNQCWDCTPEYKQAMMRKGACEHPETVFIRAKRFKGEVIGVCIDTRYKKTSKWEMAVMGMSGDIVHMPPPEVIEQKLSKISKDAEPKKRGPRFKKDRV